MLVCSLSSWGGSSQVSSYGLSYFNSSLPIAFSYALGNRRKMQSSRYILYCYLLQQCWYITVLLEVLATVMISFRNKWNHLGFDPRAKSVLPYKVSHCSRGSTLARITKVRHSLSYSSVLSKHISHSHKPLTTPSQKEDECGRGAVVVVEPLYWSLKKVLFLIHLLLFSLKLFITVPSVLIFSTRITYNFYILILLHQILFRNERNLALKQINMINYTMNSAITSLAP